VFYLVISVLFSSIYLYCLLAGADYGAGILALTTSGEQGHRTRLLVTRAMVPLWEVNHIGIIIAGSLVAGRITPIPKNIIEVYISPWFNLFSISTGIFLCFLFPFIASIYLIGYTDHKDITTDFIKKSKQITLKTVITGGLVFLASWADNNEFIFLFYRNAISVIFIVAATISLPSLWKALALGSIWVGRVIAGAELFFILGAFNATYFPVIVVLKHGEKLTLFNSGAPETTFNRLGWLLIASALIIFPTLFYL
jgi:cytochrome bd ubiquinol oxidase subunit II